MVYYRSASPQFFALVRRIRLQGASIGRVTAGRHSGSVRPDTPDDSISSFRNYFGDISGMEARTYPLFTKDFGHLNSSPAPATLPLSFSNVRWAHHSTWSGPARFLLVPRFPKSPDCHARPPVLLRHFPTLARDHFASATILPVDGMRNIFPQTQPQPASSRCRLLHRSRPLPR
ncbi:hypothetical protein CCUS01_01727 [Colletotrichum cuscutae]|uniref:Uncharacterized protein n=1 Tax=Colletotrichum cuscutae TaxID=1209917 RepID=A0AAI9UF44_9PEZI|nr:hypothetical protein CCUS01_01727 [Colletotrichum cuscutae]